MPEIPEPTPQPELDGMDSNANTLAELDALLERMMALPVSGDESDPARRREAPPDDIPIITVTETVAHLADVSSSLPIVSTDAEDLYFRAVLDEHNQEPTRPPEPVVIQNPEPTPPTKPDAGLVSAPVLSAPDDVPPIWLRGLTWSNVLFDSTLSRLGKPGRWLCSGKGRRLLGWSGALMVVLVVGLAVHDYLAWTR